MYLAVLSCDVASVLFDYMYLAVKSWNSAAVLFVVLIIISALTQVNKNSIIYGTLYRVKYFKCSKYV